MKEEDINRDKIEDQLLKDLFQDFEPELAPESLKQATMNRVLKDWTENSVAYKPLINKSNRLWLLGGFAALLAITFMVDASVLVNYWEQLNIDTSLIDFSSIGSGFDYVGGVFKSLPTIMYFIAIGVLGLLGMDQLFSKLSNI
ncbi:MAG: hypothetical protein N4A74_17375 [Carboxylicivirga sp.]|jgi:hypothetical protein|nr:hypothetical protein [Carboxylicivirga sp.]